MFIDVILLIASVLFLVVGFILGSHTEFDNLGIILIFIGMIGFFVSASLAASYQTMTQREYNECKRLCNDKIGLGTGYNELEDNYVCKCRYVTKEPMKEIVMT